AVGVVRVRVLLARPPVRGPARVPDADAAGAGRLAEALAEVHELARRAAQVGLAVDVEGRDAGRVIPAVLEAREPLEEDGLRLPLAEVTDDAAHLSLRSLAQTATRRAFVPEPALEVVPWCRDGTRAFPT